MLILSRPALASIRRGSPSGWLAIGIFLVANLMRLLLLRGTGDQSLQIDYALIPLIFWGTRKLDLAVTAQMALGALVAGLVVGGDLLDIMSRRFNWSQGVVIDYAYSAPDLPWPAITPFVILGVLAAGLLVLPFALHRAVFPIWPLTILIGALLLGNGLLYGGSRGDVDASRLTRSFVTHAVSGAFNRLVIGRTLKPLTSGSMARDLLASSPPPQILSVTVESFGLARDPAQRAMLLQPLLQALSGRYAVKVGAHSFEGSTLPGEIRELCALQANGIPNTPALLAQLASSCLPARLRRLGYDTQALHGNGSLMYDRRAIYPAMGFNRARFDVDLRREAPAIGRCPGTAFGGVCDRYLYARALSLFDGRRRLVHVLTLDAHLPLPDTGERSCQAVFANDRGLCRYAQVTEASLGALGRAVAGARHQPDVIVLSGDHAPPFASTNARERFARHAVPYVVLTRMADRAG